MIQTAAAQTSSSEWLLSSWDNSSNMLSGLARPLSWCLCLVALTIVLAGCASVPGLSVIADMQAVSQLQAAYSNDSLTETEVREIARKPLPLPPGVSFEVGVLRRMFAAVVLSDIKLARETYQIFIKYPASLETNRYLMRSMLASVEGGSGNFQTALRLLAGNLSELGDDRIRNAKKEVDLDAIQSTLWPYIDLAIDADLELAKRLHEKYAYFFENSAYGPEGQKLLKSRYYRQRGYLASHQGNREEAHKWFVSALQQLQTTSSEHDTLMKFWSQRSVAYTDLIESETQAGNYTGAAKFLDEFSRDINNYERFPGMHRTSLLRYRRGQHAFFKQMGAFNDEYEVIKSGLSNQSLVIRLNPVMQASALLALATNQINRSDFRGALQTLTSPIFSVTTRESGLTRTYFLATRSYAAALNGDASQDLSELDGLTKKEYQQPDLELLVLGSRAIAHQRKAIQIGNTGDTLKSIESARKFTAVFRKKRARELGSEVSQGLLPLIRHVAEAYLLMAISSLNRNGVTPNDVLDAISLIQTSGTDDAIAAAAIRQKNIPGVSQSNLRKFQDLQQSSRAAQGAYAVMAKAADADPTKLSALAHEAEIATEALMRFQNELKEISPAFSQAFSTHQVTLANVQSRLFGKEGLALIVPTQNSTAVVLTTKSKVALRTVPITRQQGEKLTARIRRSTTFNADVQVPQFDVEAAKELYGTLFEWAKPILSDLESLTVVAEGSYASIPFSLLVRSDGRSNDSMQDYKHLPWMIKSIAITHAPTVSSWLAISRSTRQQYRMSFLAWADPDFGDEAEVASGSTRSVRGAVRSGSAAGATSTKKQLPASLKGMLPALPETKQEALAIASVLRGSAQPELVTGSEATKSSVIGMSNSGVLATKNIVLFATHGLAPNQVQGLYQPALAMSHEPADSYPSLLQLEDVVGLRMNAEWVILSACNTASADRAGGDSLSGLARGFFFAGTKSLLVTHWEVESESAAAITVKAMERYAADSRTTRAQALRQTQMELIEGKRRTPAEWAHPAYWAAYALVGDGRR